MMEMVQWRMICFGTDLSANTAFQQLQSAAVSMQNDENFLAISIIG